MKSRITVVVAGQDYVLLTDEEETYVQRVAAQVDAEIANVREGGGLSLLHAAIMAALNMADKVQKMADTADHLRGQVREYLEDTQKLKAELNEARREISRLRNTNR
ncbi:MAG: cell division protein ZapA [Oscillospiraceae bacterium]|jgi:cell division protein ZapA|nr:cell division protein ZapA [Oscillospiraceae bacterium]